MKYILLFLLPILAACNHNPVVPSIPTVEVVKKINIPATLLQECPVIKSEYPSRIEDILLEDLDIIQMYGECRTRNSKLIQAIQEITK